MPVSTTLEPPVIAPVPVMPPVEFDRASDTVEFVDTINAVVYVIQSTFNFLDPDNRPASVDDLVVDEGWFSDNESATARCEQLNARAQAYYDASMATNKRRRDAAISAAEKKNLEAAAIRSAGMLKADVSVPPSFVPESFAKFFAGSNHTTYVPIAIRRSDHDGIARAVTV